MVVFDASILIHVLTNTARSSVPNAFQRVMHRVDQLSAQGSTIIVPTPALSECLVYAGTAGPAYLSILDKAACSRISSFDQRAAVEAAIRTHDAIKRGQKKGGDPSAPKAKIKFDRQIVAIAVVEGATAIYSDDEHIATYAREAGLHTIALKDLPLPEPELQGELGLSE